MMADWRARRSKVLCCNVAALQLLCFLCAGHETAQGIRFDWSDYRVKRDRYCPSLFSPMNNYFSKGADHQGCCVLDKAVGMLELLWSVDKCHRYETTHAAVGDKGALRHELKPCYSGAAEQLQKDLLDCCRIPASYGRGQRAHQHFSAAALFSKSLAPASCKDELADVLGVFKTLFVPSYENCVKVEDNFPKKVIGETYYHFIVRRQCFKARNAATFTFRKLLATAHKLYKIGGRKRDIPLAAKKFMNMCIHLPDKSKACDDNVQTFVQKSLRRPPVKLPEPPKLPGDQKNRWMLAGKMPATSAQQLASARKHETDDVKLQLRPWLVNKAKKRKRTAKMALKKQGKSLSKERKMMLPIGALVDARAMWDGAKWQHAKVTARNTHTVTYTVRFDDGDTMSNVAFSNVVPRGLHKHPKSRSAVLKARLAVPKTKCTDHTRWVKDCEKLARQIEDAVEGSSLAKKVHQRNCYKGSLYSRVCPKTCSTCKLQHESAADGLTAAGTQQSRPTQAKQHQHNSDTTPVALARGQRVESKWGETGKWLAGTVTRVQDDGSYTVRFDTGDEESEVQRSHLRMVAATVSPTPSPTTTTAAPTPPPTPETAASILRRAKKISKKTLAHMGLKTLEKAELIIPPGDHLKQQHEKASKARKRLAMKAALKRKKAAKVAMEKHSKKLSKERKTMLPVGTLVEAKAMYDGAEWLRATVIALHPASVTYTVRFDDGDSMSGIAASHVVSRGMGHVHVPTRRPAPQPTPVPTPAPTVQGEPSYVVQDKIKGAALTDDDDGTDDSATPTDEKDKQYTMYNGLTKTELKRKQEIETAVSASSEEKAHSVALDTHAKREIVAKDMEEAGMQYYAMRAMHQGNEASADAVRDAPPECIECNSEKAHK